MNQAEPKPFSLTVRISDIDAGRNPAFLEVAGVTVLTRLILGAAGAGATRISVVGTSEEAVRTRSTDYARLKDLDILWDAAATEPDESDILVEANVVVGNPVWRLLAECARPTYVPGAPVMARMGAGQPEPLWQRDQPPGAYVVAVAGESDVAAAKDAIFANVTKPTSGPISRKINARISIPISRILCEFGVTPNQMTLVTTVVGFVSAWFMAQGTLFSVAVGGALFQLCAALDRVDGELARSMFRASPRGAWIDTLGDNLVYLVFAVGLIIGYHRYATAYDVPFAGWVLPLGISMVLLMLVLVAGMTWYLVDNRQPGTMTAVHQNLGEKMDTSRTNWLFKFLDSLKILGKRDSFSFIVFLLAITPALTGNPLAFHILFWLSMVGILFTSIHFGMAITISRRHKTVALDHEC